MKRWTDKFKLQSHKPLTCPRCHSTDIIRVIDHGNSITAEYSWTGLHCHECNTDITDHFTLEERSSPWR